MILASSVWPTIWLQVTDTTQLDEGCRKETTKTDVHDQAALDDLDDRTGDHAVFFFELLDLAPGTFVLGTLAAEDQTTLFVFLGENQRFDGLAHRHHFTRINVVADR